MDKLKDWELKPEEVEAARIAGTNKRSLATNTKDVMLDIRNNVARAIADAAVKKVVGWLDDNNGSSVAHGFGAGVGDDELLLDRDDWQAIKQEVGL